MLFRSIIGLVTDELAVKQKRKPSMPYDHRRAILEALSCVDMVVSHSGDNKKVALEKLHFTDLFIGDEYYGTKEYEEVPDVRVHYLPCPHARKFSSSEIAKEKAIDTATKLKVFHKGPGGIVYLLDDEIKIIIKAVFASIFEERGIRTANVFNLPVPPPRNQIGAAHTNQYPNLPGVNVFREIDTQAIIMGKKWCPTLAVTLAYSEDVNYRLDMGNALEFVNHAKSEMCSQTYFIHQRYAGVKLDKWIYENSERDDFRSEERRVGKEC